MTSPIENLKRMEKESEYAWPFWPEITAVIEAAQNVYELMDKTVGREIGLQQVDISCKHEEVIDMICERQNKLKDALDKLADKDRGIA